MQKKKKKKIINIFKYKMNHRFYHTIWKNTTFISSINNSITRTNEINSVCVTEHPYNPADNI